MAVMERTPSERLADAAVVICPATAGGALAVIGAATVGISLTGGMVLLAAGAVCNVAAVVGFMRLARTRCAEARADEFRRVLYNEVPSERRG